MLLLIVTLRCNNKLLLKLQPECNRYDNNSLLINATIFIFSLWYVTLMVISCIILLVFKLFEGRSGFGNEDTKLHTNLLQTT